MSFITLDKSENWWAKCNECGFVHSEPRAINDLLPPEWLWEGEKIYCPRCKRMKGDGKMTHSKGPWQNAGDYGNYAVEIQNAKGGAVCNVWTKQATNRGIESWPEGEANARLIEQAPEMLEALEMAEHSFAQTEPTTCGLRPDEREAWATMRAVIARVKGQGQ